MSMIRITISHTEVYAVSQDDLPEGLDRKLALELYASGELNDLCTDYSESYSVEDIEEEGGEQ